MIYRTLSVSAVIAAGLTLSACTLRMSSTVNQNRWMKKEVSVVKLKNGKQLMVGYRSPSQANQCRLVGKESKNWAQIKFKEQFKPHIALASSGYWGIKQIAMAYANAHPTVNYAYLLIPNTSSVMGFNLHNDAQAVLSYYSCKKPPAKHSNL